VTAGSYVVDDVVQLSHNASALGGAHVDLPGRGQHGSSHLLEVAGWAVGRLAPVRGVSIHHGGSSRWAATFGIERPDLRHTVVYDAGSCDAGFNALLLLPSLPGSFCLDVVVELEGGLTAPIAQIRGRHENRFPDEPHSLSPLMVTSLGPTEASRLLRLIARHRQVAFDPITGPEFGPARYWMQRFRELLVHPHGSGGAQTFQLDGRSDSSAEANPFRNNDVRSWFETEHVERTAAWCRASIEGTYQAVAASLGRSSVIRFVERFGPGEDARLLGSLYPGATEVVLVRDPRDLLCSLPSAACELGLEPEGGRLAAKMRMLYAAVEERPSSMLVHYEELVADTPNVMRTILEQAGLDASAAMIEAIVSPEVYPGEEDTHRAESAAAPAGGWRRELPSATIAAWAHASGFSSPASDDRIDAASADGNSSRR
jgi:hypothetical protein